MGFCHGCLRSYLLKFIVIFKFDVSFLDAQMLLYLNSPYCKRHSKGILGTKNAVLFVAMEIESSIKSMLLESLLCMYSKIFLLSLI